MTYDRRSLTSALAALPAALCLPGRAGAAGARLHVVRISKMRFGPVPTALKVGDTIEWSNEDLFQHTATARNDAFDVDLKPGAKARTRLNAPGVIAFYCRYHPGMKGRLAVAP